MSESAVRSWRFRRLWRARLLTQTADDDDIAQPNGSAQRAELLSNLKCQLARRRQNQRRDAVRILRNVLQDRQCECRSFACGAVRNAKSELRERMRIMSASAVP